jgi:hypothetical protein
VAVWGNDLGGGVHLSARERDRQDAGTPSAMQFFAAFFNSAGSPGSPARRHVR